MFRSPQLFTSSSLRGTHRSLLQPKEALLSICPIHQKWNGVQRKRALSHERSCVLKKGEELQGELPQDPMRKEEIVFRETQGSSVSFNPPIQNELTGISPRLQTSKPPVNTHFVCSVQPQSSIWLVPPYDHCQSNSLKYLISPDTLCRSGLKCLLLHSRSQAVQQKGGFIKPHNADSQQYLYASVPFVHGSQKPLFARSFVSAPKLWTRSPVAGRHLSAQVCAMHSAAQLKVALQYCLSAENEARCRKRLEPNVTLYQKDKGKSWAAVLVCLCTAGGEPAFLFTLRSSTLKGRHKGDVSFAGGKKDPADQDVVATALREAREELGITVRTDQVWGVLKPLRDMSGMLIAPVLANLGPLEALSFRPNPSEVEEIFTLTLAHVCNPDNRGYTNFRTGNKYGYTLPVFRNGKHRVWGLTAVALDHTLKLIVPP
ncbi:hypothetical protein ACEWY4_008752 [Coilia grayii]|uniref:Nudix hydrolase domain-containing protein n=1 Tax=Coilia grayii TaxID=363190 RepID=A0ABD1KC18_9TELE